MSDDRSDTSRYIGWRGAVYFKKIDWRDGSAILERSSPFSMKVPATLDEYLASTQVDVTQRNGTVDRMPFPEYEKMMRDRSSRFGAPSDEARFETVAGHLMLVPSNEAERLTQELDRKRRQLSEEYAAMLQRQELSPVAADPSSTVDAASA